ncbi:MAG: membrane protein insertase YidC [Sphingomonadales bacterium]|nr:membrane protein insertase YidC [Sphingomonadales bacterium]
MEDKRNVIIAMLFAALILFAWGPLTRVFFPDLVPAPTQQSAPQPAAGGQAPSAAPVAAGGDIASGPAPKQKITLASALASNPRIAIETPKLKGSINLQGAKFDDLLLLVHRTELAKDSPPVRLFAPSRTEKAYFARFGWTALGIKVPGADTLWTASGSKLTPESPVKLSWSNDSGQTFQIDLSIDKDYLVTAKQSVTNNGAAAVQIAPFGLISRDGKSADPDTFNIHAGPMGVFGGAADYDWDYDDLDNAPGKQQSFKTTGGWIGFTDKYWLAAMIPDQKTPVEANMRAGGNNYQTDIVSAQKTQVAPGKSIAQTSRLFAGAKEVEILDHYTEKLGITYLDYSIDWGWFWFIAIPFFWILHWLFGIFGNFGVAIIGLTIIVRLFMFPVAQRQFASMAAMRVLQPKLKTLQERYKDDKPKLQQEMMKLYKDEKVNPLAGCLPIVLQIPVFFALYKVLMLSIEMRHQPFTLWLQDLSAPDPSAHIIWNLLGTGITLPAFLAIGVLPILLGVTMWLIQKLNPQPMDEVQKQVFAVMPWFLMFIMAPFAAGLQLYWVVSNCISIAQQKWLYSRHPVLKQQAAKEAEDKDTSKAKS